MLVGSVLQQVHLQRNCEGWHLPEAAEKVVCNPICNHLLPKACPRAYNHGFATNPISDVPLLAAPQ